MSQREGREAAIARIRHAKAVFGGRLLDHPDVHGIGIGYKTVGGKKTDELALVVHVYRKRPKAEVDPSRLLPRTLTVPPREATEEITVPVDVREKPVPIEEVDCGTCDEDTRLRRRPVVGGYSGGPIDQSGGTLGGWLWDTITEQFVVISNEHVLGSTGGTAVVQPAVADGGSDPADTIGAVVRAGTLDVAIAAPSEGVEIDCAIICSSPAVFETTDAFLEMEIEKVGRTTGLTCGLVELIDYDSNHYGSHNDLWISGDGSDFSLPGDSGSLYVERVNPNGDSWKRIVGIHWGGAADDGVGHPIGAVMADLSLTTVCDGVTEAFIEAVFGEDEEAIEEAVGEQARVSVLVGARGPRTKRLPLRRSFGRKAEATIGSTEVGAHLNELLHRHRVEAVNLLLDPDGRRAALALLAPVARSGASVDELLEHVVSDRDQKNAERFASVVRKLAPTLSEELSFVSDLMTSAAGAALGEVLSRSPQ